MANAANRHSRGEEPHRARQQRESASFSQMIRPRILEPGTARSGGMTASKPIVKPVPLPKRPAPAAFTMRNLWRMTLWGGATASALLIAVLASRSDVGAQRIAGLFSIRGDRTQMAARPFDAEAEARRLAEAVRSLDAENRELKSRLAAVEHSVDDITGSVARQIEAIKKTSSGPLPAAVPAPNRAPPAAAAPASKAATIEPPANAAPASDQPAAAAPLPAPQHAATPAPPVPSPHAAAPAPNAAAPAPHAESPAPAPPPPQYGVDIGSAVSIQVLRARWLGIRSAHAQLFDGLMPVVMLREVPQTGRVELRLVVGPLANAEAAAKLCAKLVPYRLSCQPTLFSGQHVALQ